MDGEAPLMWTNVHSGDIILDTRIRDWVSRASLSIFMFQIVVLNFSQLFRKWQVLIPILIIMIFFTMLREYGDLFDASLFEPIN